MSKKKKMLSGLTRACLTHKFGACSIAPGPQASFDWPTDVPRGCSALRNFSVTFILPRVPGK